MQYYCRVGTQEGKIVEGYFEGESEDLLRQELIRKGYHVFEIRRRGVSLDFLTSFFRGVKRRKRVDPEKFLIFNKELAVLLRAGIPLLQTLEILKERVEDPEFRQVIEDVYDDVKSGSDLSAAFERHGDVVPRVYPATLKAGERTGELSRVIERFAYYYQLLIDARSKIISALVYPIVLIMLSFGMLVIMGVYVVPKFNAFFADLEVELPWLTVAIIAAGSFVNRNIFYIIFVAFIIWLAMRNWLRSPRGKRLVDYYKLKIPLVGEMLRDFFISEYCRSLATLLDGGLPLVESLRIATSSLSNWYIQDKLQPVIEKVKEGKALYESLEATSLFEGAAIDMVRVGEATGSLGEMLHNISTFIDQQVEMRMRRILSLIEPLMLVIMGVIIGILLIAIYVPMFTAIGNLR